MTEEELLTEALQGDPQAIRQVAQRLKSPPIAELMQAADARYDFRAAADAFKAKHREEFERNPAFYAEVVKQDSAIAALAPDMRPADRLPMAYKAAGGGANTEGGGASRARPKQEEIEEDDHMGETRSYESTSDEEIAMDHQEALDRMRKARGGTPMNFDASDFAKPPMDDEERARKEAMRGIKQGRRTQVLNEGD